MFQALLLKKYNAILGYFTMKAASYPCIKVTVTFFFFIFTIIYFLLYNIVIFNTLRSRIIVINVDQLMRYKLHYIREIWMHVIIYKGNVHNWVSMSGNVFMHNYSIFLFSKWFAKQSYFWRLSQFFFWH